MTGATLAAAARVRPTGVSRFFEHQLVRFRTTWRGTLVGGVLSPVFFLVSIGVGIGSQIDSTETDLGTADYLSFVGPGLMAASAMQQAASESLWRTAGALRWRGHYVPITTTPLTVGELVTGHILWVAFRALVAAVLYLGVLAVFGVVGSPLALLAPLVAAWVAAAFCAPISAWTARTTTETSYPIILRMGIVPLFLFSGVFFPVEQLPGILPSIARLTPVWHGVRLCQGLVAGDGLSLGAAGVHLLVIGAFVVVGWLAAIRTFSGALTT